MIGAMRLLALLVGITAGCGDNHAMPDAPTVVDDTVRDVPPGVDATTLTPTTLAGTGLCLDTGCTQISADARPYVPAYALWSDGATKRRWISLPPGTQIDTSDMNYWKFPVGTKLWKEFTRAGVRCETRYIVKLADEATPPPAVSWYYVSYQWNLAQTDTVAVTSGATDVNGTNHDIPSRGQCRTCHDHTRGPGHDRGRILGFSAMSLDEPAQGDNVTLATLVAESKLTDPPPPPATTGDPFFPTTFTAHEQAAFGYMHANCAHCHNPSSAFHDAFPLELRFDTTKLGPATGAPEYTTTVNVVESQTYAGLPVGAVIVKPNDTAQSVLYQRMIDTNFIVGHMPALGSELTDTTGGVAVMAAWIGDL